MKYKKLFAKHVLTVLFVGVSVYLCQLGLSELVLAHQTSDLKRMRARVDYAGVSKRPGTKLHPTAWIVQVSYDYEVNNKPYKSNSIRRGKQVMYRTEESARAFIADFQQGEIVRAYYNPANPRNAVLVAGSFIEGILLMLGGIFGVYTGISALLETKKRMGMGEEASKHAKKTKETKKPDLQQAPQVSNG